MKVRKIRTYRGRPYMQGESYKSGYRATRTTCPIKMSQRQRLSAPIVGLRGPWRLVPSWLKLILSLGCHTQGSGIVYQILPEKLPSTSGKERYITIWKFARTLRVSGSSLPEESSVETNVFAGFSGPPPCRLHWRRRHFSRATASDCHGGDSWTVWTPGSRDIRSYQMEGRQHWNGGMFMELQAPTGLNKGCFTCNWKTVG